MTQLRFEVTGMHCASCGLLVDDAVEDIPGVIASTTNLRTRTTTVDIAETPVDPAQIITAISAVGYTARHTPGD